MKTIKLTQNQVAKISDHRYKEISEYKWYAKWNENTESFYAVRNIGKSPNQRQLHMSRFIAQTQEGQECDHINHDTLDNQDHNLRNVTSSQNSINRRLRKDNKTREKNITVYRKGFRVLVTVKGKGYIKDVKTMEEALNVRAEFRKLQGEYVSPL